MTAQVRPTGAAPQRADAEASEPAPRPAPQRSPFGGMMPGGPPQKAKRFGASARRLLALVSGERVSLVLVAALLVGSAVLTVAGPKVLGDATNVIVAGARGALDFAALRHELGLALVLYAAASACAWGSGRILNALVQRVVRGLRSEVQAKLARLPLAYFDRQPHGELLSRVTNDIDNAATSIQQVLSQVMGSALLVLGVLVMLVVISPLLSLIALVTVPLSVFVTARIARRSQGRFAAQWAHVGALNGQIEEAFTGHALIKVLGRRREVEARFAAKNAELYDAALRAQFLSSLILPAVTFIGNLTFVAIAVVGGLRVSAGLMTLGGIQAFLQYSRQFTQQLSQLAQVATVVQSGVASAERVFELLDAEEQTADPATPPSLPAVRGEVRFEHVAFSYRPDQPLIEDLSLVAAPGQTVAIVGPTGAGKTTLVNLILRFYELAGGRITLDGVDIATLARGDLRSRIGMVLQDSWLFGGTIRENLRYGNPAASDEAVIAAAKATYVDRFVRALPDGYDTVLDDGAGRLSAGERQLITIARAFLADPAILILDEATSSVDTRTEVLVQRAMAALRAGRTSFVIAHRLSTIRDAHVILVMEAGKIVEQGTHAELLAAHGAYHALYHAQFAAPAGATAT